MRGCLHLEELLSQSFRVDCKGSLGRWTLWEDIAKVVVVGFGFDGFGMSARCGCEAAARRCGRSAGDYQGSVATAPTGGVRYAWSAEYLTSCGVQLARGTGCGLPHLMEVA